MARNVPPSIEKSRFLGFRSAFARVVATSGLVIVANLSFAACKLTPRVPESPLDSGDPAAAFSLPDSQGTPHSLAEHIARGPTVLVFYRGHW